MFAQHSRMRLARAFRIASIAAALVLAADAIGARTIVRTFGDCINNFHCGLISASGKQSQNDPAALRVLLAGWFQAVGPLRGHRQAEVAAKHTGVSPAAARPSYDETTPVMSNDGRFEPRALNVLATLFVEMHMLPAKPEMSTLISDAFMSK